VSNHGDESPHERLARWTATDAAIGSAVEVDELRARLAERDAETDDLRARLAHLASRVAQVEAENAELRGSARRPSLGRLARRAYRRARSVAASRLQR
jgi:uncharacterized coiled-coil protein SlyX